MRYFFNLKDCTVGWANLTMRINLKFFVSTRTDLKKLLIGWLIWQIFVGEDRFDKIISWGAKWYLMPLCFRNLPLNIWTESDGIIRLGAASESATCIIESIRVGVGASWLKKIWIIGWLALFRTTVGARTTVLWFFEGGTSAFACGYAINSEVRRAHIIQIRHTTSTCTVSRPTKPFNNHRQIITIHQAHVIEVLRWWTDCKFH